MTGTSDRATVPTAASRPRGVQRRELIVHRAAELFSRNGYAAVGMNEIGAASGVTGPAIYRHFESKSALLAAVIDRVIDSVMTFDETAIDREDDPVRALDTAIRRYADAVARQRSVMAVFVREVHHLPAAEQHRLRARQRELVRRWRELLAGVHPEWPTEQVRTAVHGAFGLLNSVGLFSSPLPDDVLGDQLAALCRGTLALG